MSTEFVFGLVGAILTFFGIVIGALLGIDAIRKRPIIGLGVAAAIVSGGVLILFAIAAQLGAGIGTDQTADALVEVAATQTALVNDDLSFEVQVAIGLTQTSAAIAEGSSMASTASAGSEEFGEEPSPGQATVMSPSATATPEGQSVLSRIERMQSLNSVYENEGVEAWLHASGASWETLTATLPEPVRSTVGGQSVVAAMQVQATGLDVPWPACMTTDHSVPIGPNTRTALPDIYTEVTGFDGRATIWVDCTDNLSLHP